MWKPINMCSLLSPHTGESEQYMNDGMNEDHLNPEVPFKSDWESMDWDTMRRFNHLN